MHIYIMPQVSYIPINKGVKIRIECNDSKTRDQH